MYSVEVGAKVPFIALLRGAVGSPEIIIPHAWQMIKSNSEVSSYFKLDLFKVKQALCMRLLSDEKQEG